MSKLVDHAHLIRKLKRLRFLGYHALDKSARNWAWQHLERLYQFENRHFGESCFIIGNGPSLNKMDLTLLKGCRCFGLNKIYLHPDLGTFGIDYHVAVNPLVIQQSFNEFSRLNCPTFLSYKSSLSQDIDKSNYFYLLSGDGHYFSPNPYQKIAEGCTVTFVALQLAYFMGFSNVFLIGVDHEFEVNGTPHEKQLLDGPDRNHFHPDYFAKQEWHLPDLEGSELAYQLARYYFNRHKRMIYDATEGGKLTVFPKLPFEKAVQACQT